MPPFFSWPRKIGRLKKTKNQERRKGGVRKLSESLEIKTEPKKKRKRKGNQERKRKQEKENPRIKKTKKGEYENARNALLEKKWRRYLKR